MTKQRIYASDTALSESHINEMHDNLTLALDATECRYITYESVKEARSYIRASQRILDGLAQ